MPLINFKLAKKVALGYKQAKKVYVGDKLVWELITEELLESIIFEPSGEGRMSTSELQIIKDGRNVFLREPYEYNIRKGFDFIKSSVIPNLNDDVLFSTRVPLYELKIKNMYKDIEKIILWNPMEFKGTIRLIYANGKVSEFDINHIPSSTNNKITLDLTGV